MLKWKQALATALVWAAMLAGLFLLSQSSPFALGAISGIGAVVMLVIVITRIANPTTAARLWRAMFAIPLVVAGLGLLHGRSFALGALLGGVLIPAIVGAVWGARWLERRALVRFDAWCARGLDDATVLARVRGWSVASAYEAVRSLAAHDRIADAEALLLAIADLPAWQLERAALLVELRLALGNQLGARAAVEVVRAMKLAPGVAEVPALLDARIRIADGKGKAVARELAGKPTAAMSPRVRELRQLVCADACVASGDRAGARRLVEAVAQARPGLVATLARAKRPLAPIAAELVR